MGAELNREYDVVVVGGGAAGCVLARRLAEDPALTVLLIEAGGPDDADVVRRASEWTGLLGGELDWGETYAPGPQTAGRSIPIPRGRVLGGSSSLNAMLWYRGHPDDYDAWEAAGAQGWNYASLLPYFRRSEDWHAGQTPHRGTGGPMRIEVSRDPHPVAEAMLTGAAELGLPVIDDPNSGDNAGACLANFNAVTLPEGHPDAGRMERWSTVRGYLRPARDWPNLTVLTGSEVTGLVMEGARCRGVVHRTGQGTRTTTAHHGVVLTLGAFGTPRLLMRSGIGDTDQLAGLGIEPRLHLPGVGKNFQDHPLLMGMNFRLREPLGRLRDNGGGTMLNWRSEVADHRPDLHAFVVQGTHVGPGIAARYGITPGDPAVCAISPGLMRSRSVGELHMIDAAGTLAIQPNYLAEPEDLSALIDSLDTVMDLVGTGDYRRLIAGPLSPPGQLCRRDKEEFVRQACDTFFHCCGSARMGTDEMSVVSPELAVHGAKNLWVADASVIPVIPTCNIQAPVVALAERAADLLHGDLGSQPAADRHAARETLP